MKIHPLVTVATTLGLCACSILFPLDPPESNSGTLDGSLPQGNDAATSGDGSLSGDSAPSSDAGFDGSATTDASSRAQYLVWAGGDNTRKNDAGDDEVFRNESIFLSKRRADGTLEPWQQGPTISYGNAGQRTTGVAGIGKFLYVVQPYASVLVYELANGRLSLAGTFPAPPGFLANEACMVALGNRLYINDGFMILTASASGATVGGWQVTPMVSTGRLTNTFPEGNFLFFGEPNRIMRLRISASGLPDGPVMVVGPSAAPTSEFGTISGGIAIYGNQIFQLGGFPAGPINSVWQTELPADAGPDGAALSWRTTEPLPQVHENTSIVRTDTHLYVVGNYGKGSVSSTPLLAQGAIGIFTSTTPLPKPVFGRCNAALLQE